MPIGYREWFLKRIGDEIDKSQGNQSKAIHNNTPEVNALTGKHRSNSPSRLRRFT
jgi:hypothetical protein